MGQAGDAARVFASRVDELEARVMALEAIGPPDPGPGPGPDPGPDPNPDPDPDPVPVPQPGDTASSITRHGITWTFESPKPVGVFANGDQYVIGPVAIVGINPPSTMVGSRVRHGSMKNPATGGNVQGYDSSTANTSYQASKNVGLGVGPGQPLDLVAGDVLVSSITHSGSGVRPQLKTAAVLTVLAEHPPAGSFRPAYCGPDRAVRFQASTMETSILPSLAIAPGAPSLDSLEAAFDRVWLDHGNNWQGREIHPSDNMPDYGRDMSALISNAALALASAYSSEQKMPLLIRMVQLGIDFKGLVDGGNFWLANGGHASGRKFPILFAGVMLNDDAMRNIGSVDVAFGEDQQTFYVEETSPGVYNGGHGGYSASDVGLAEWGVRHAEEPQRDSKTWNTRYRQCCTANVWGGMALVMRAMGLMSTWNHPSFFEYLDRYMDFEEGVGSTAWHRSYHPWAGSMWDLHRASL